MSERRNGGRGTLLVGLGLVACCLAGPLLLVVGGGLLASAWGTAVRFWPVTILGLAAALWAGGRLASLIRARARATRDVDARDH